MLQNRKRCEVATRDVSESELVAADARPLHRVRKTGTVRIGRRLGHAQRDQPESEVYRECIRIPEHRWELPCVHRQLKAGGGRAAVVRPRRALCQENGGVFWRATTVNKQNGTCPELRTYIVHTTDHMESNDRKSLVYEAKHRVQQ